MEHDEPEIELGSDSVAQHPIVAPRPQQPIQVVGQVGGASPRLPIFVHLDTVATILPSLPRAGLMEAGGLLVGHKGVDANGEYLVVSDAIVATLARGERASFTFTHEAWAQMLDYKHRHHADEVVVGWYHTHPRLGVFLSGRDLFIQQHFFADNRQIAVVIDPADFTWGVFFWEQDSLVAAQSYYIYGDVDRPYQGLAELLGEYRKNWQVA